MVDGHQYRKRPVCLNEIAQDRGISASRTEELQREPSVKVQHLRLRHAQVVVRCDEIPLVAVRRRVGARRGVSSPSWESHRDDVVLPQQM